jgi:two-component system, sensor histidine kinase FlrB
MKNQGASVESPAENLAGAFELFLEASQAIESQHAALTRQLEDLREDLGRTSASLKLVLNALPAAVIVIEDQRVSHFNTAAKQLLPDLLTDQTWQLPKHWKTGCGPREYLIETEESQRTVQVQLSQQDQRSVIQVQDITENLRSKEEQERVGRLASMGQMSASIAHQLRTPLATALLYSSHLCSQTLPSERKTEFAEQLKQQLLNLEKLSSNMLKFLQTKPSVLEAVSLVELLDQAARQLEAACAARKVEITLLCEQDCTLLLDRSAVVSALVGVIENGVAVSSPGQLIAINGAVSERHCAITIDDSGPGIAADMIKNLFEPFASSRIEGTGLGLAIARNTIRNHSGDIAAENKLNGGARFTITLPIAELN